MRNYYCTLCGYRYISTSGSEDLFDTSFRMPHPDKARLPGPPVARSDFGLLSESCRCPRCGALKRFFRPEGHRPARGNAEGRS